MALSDYIYSDGTISVTNSQTGFTGAGTAWLLRDAVGAIVIVGGILNVVGSISTDSAGEFMDNWTGPTQANVRYKMWLVTAEAATNLANHFRLAQIIASIEGAQEASPVLAALAALTPSADKLAFFTDADSADLVDLKAWARSFLGLTMAANKLSYGTGENTMALTDLTAAGRALLNIVGAPVADKLSYLTSANAAALADLTAAGRALIGAANAAAQKTELALVKADVGLGNVDNTSDANKPVSTVQAAANALRLLKSGDTISGTLNSTQTPDNWQFKTSTPVNLAAGTNYFFTAGSGLFIATDEGSGSTALYIVGGGIVTLIAQTGTTFGTVVGGGGGNKFGYAAPQTVYYIGNTNAFPITLHICAIRTRPNA